MIRNGSPFSIALEYLPSPTLIVAGNRQVLFANIVEKNAYNIVIEKSLALTFRRPCVLNTIKRTLAFKIA